MSVVGAASKTRVQRPVGFAEDPQAFPERFIWLEDMVLAVPTVDLTRTEQAPLTTLTLPALRRASSSTS